MSSTCGCCGGSPHTPLATGNPPGRDALSYRVGTHPAFFAAMRSRLSSAKYPALAALTTHDVGDPSIALLDAWAVVGDVLTFYQERIANEGYLRTATERRSILEQARLVGYRPRPGVAASVYLAYTIDENAGPVEIPAGARVNSVPGPGEQMQAFETSEVLEARHEWNQLGVRLARPQTPASILADGLYLAGVATGLKAGDALLVDFGVGMAPAPLRVKDLLEDADHDRTHVVLVGWDGSAPALSVMSASLRRLADPGRRGVPSGATADQVTQVLGELSALADTGEPSEVAAKVRSALPDLTGHLDTAQRNNWARLVPWLDEIVTGLSALGQLATGSATGPASMAKQTEDPFGDLVKGLEEPPSLPPRSARRLDRSVEAAFAKNADIYPALLTKLQPRLGPVLYTALGNADATPPSKIRVIALREAASLFGHNAPPEVTISGGTVTTSEWDVDNDEDATIAHLDRVYPGVTAGSQVLITRPATDDFPATVVTTVKSVTEESRGKYGLVGKITTLGFSDAWWDPIEWQDGESQSGSENFDVLRAATVYCRSELLPLADAPIGSDICGGEVELDRLYDGLRSGRWMVLSGERADLPGTAGVHAAELVMLAGVSQRVATFASVATTAEGEGETLDQPLPGDALHTFVTFAKPLAYCYRRETVVLHGNVVHATHGETRTEVFGGGDATKTFQTFTLKQSPLTWTSAPTVSGTASSLEVRVGDIAWHEAASIVALGPDSRGFLTRQDDAGATSVVFGNGVYGARLPTGAENVRATYRSGIGRPGNVVPDQLSLLATKPLGVKGVTNPLRSSGGADAEGRDQARRNAPLAVMALDRLVSTQDYADFARTFAGVGKASATRLTDGRRQLVHVTVAGAGDIPIDVTSDLFRNLTEALHRYGDPYLPIRLEVRDLLALVVGANIKVLPDHDWEVVEPAVRARLLDAFGFDRRELGQDVLASEVLAVAQAVRGVDYVDLDVLRAITEEDVVRRLAEQADEIRNGPTQPAVPPTPPPAPSPSPNQRIVVWPARVVDGVIHRAQLAYLQPGVQDSLILTEVST